MSASAQGGRRAIRPAPTDEEAAAIVAAVDAVWPHATAAAPPAVERWRWSGRWWTKPVSQRRRRPW